MWTVSRVSYRLHTLPDSNLLTIIELLTFALCSTFNFVNIMWDVDFVKGIISFLYVVDVDIIIIVTTIIAIICFNFF